MYLEMHLGKVSIIALGGNSCSKFGGCQIHIKIWRNYKNKMYVFILQFVGKNTLIIIIFYNISYIKKKCTLLMEEVIKKRIKWVVPGY